MKPDSEGEQLARLILAVVSKTATKVSKQQETAFTAGLTNALSAIGVELHRDSESVEGALTALRRVVALRGLEDKLESLENAFTGVGTSFEKSAAELTGVGEAFERTGRQLAEQLAAAEKVSRSIEESADKLVLGLQSAGQTSSPCAATY